MLLSLLKAFLVGGALCAVAQIFIDYTKATAARILVSYVLAGVFLSAIGVYQPLVDFAGAGAAVPIIGFGHVLAKGVKTAVMESGAIGIITGGLTAASAGIAAVVIFSFLAALAKKKKSPK